MTAPPDLAALRRVVAEIQSRVVAGQALTPAEVAGLREGYRQAAALQQAAGTTPLALSRLWRPHCQRWRGVAGDPRPVGCAQEMTPLSRGVFACRTPGCAMEGVPEARTSQRDGIRELLTTPDLIAALIGGANRAGKTECVVQLALALAAGRGEPWVQAWARLNDIPVERIPAGPGTVWISALSFNDSKEYHRPKLDKYLPAGSKRSNWHAENQAEVTLPNGGRIVCKAAAQGRDKFQGSAVRLVVLDEEHPEEVYEESLRATAENNGLVLLSMTPLKGVTWPHRVFLRESSPNHLSYTILGLDNPHVSARALRTRFQHLSKEKMEARLFGKWATALGVIWPTFSAPIHVVDDFTLPADWRRFRALDFGLHFACLWAALDPRLDQLHFYRALKTYDVKLSENARQINLLSQGERYAWTIADPAGRDERIELASHHGIATSPANKAIEPGLDAVSERLALTNQGHPRLVVHRTAAAQLIAELPLYRRNERGEIVKANDHLCDCMRYLTYQLHVGGGMGAT